MLRSLRALWMFWTIFGSYGVQWVLTRLFGPARMRERAMRVHRRNAERLAHGFMRLRGVFIKLGQVLSVLGGFLPPEFGVALEQLQDRVPPRPFPQVEGRLHEAFGPDALSRFRSFEREPVAAASLAQVHRAVDRDGRVVAVKVKYPGIEKLVQRDLRVLRSVVPMAKRLFGFPHLDRVLAQLGEMLERETDYANERRNMERIRVLFRDRSDVVVPEIAPELTAGGVLTMSFEEGDKITDEAALAARGIDAEAVGKVLVTCYLTMLMKDRVFHADPHPGNFLVRGKGSEPVLVILDYGAVEDVTEDLAVGMQTVVLGALLRDNEQILRGVERMGFVAPGGDRELLGDVGRGYLDALADVRIDDFSRFDNETTLKLAGFEHTRGRLREIMRNIHYPDGFFYVERTLILLFGLVGKLAPKAGLPGLLAPLATQLMMSAAMGAAAGPAPQREARSEDRGL